MKTCHSIADGVLHLRILVVDLQLGILKVHLRDFDIQLGNSHLQISILDLTHQK